MKDYEMNNAAKITEIENALKSEDPKALAVLLDARYKEIENEFLKKYDELKEVTDEKILASRGIFTPTKEEKDFLDTIFKNAVGNNPNPGATVVIPKTMVERIYEDMKNDDTGILGLIDFENTTGASEWLLTVADKPTTSWGELTSEITEELSLGFKTVNTIVHKLSCYLPYSKNILNLGYAWQDAYVRKYISLGMSDAASVVAISGDGVNKPFGMAYDYDIDTKTGTKKTAVKITKFDKKTFAPLFAKLCVNPIGYNRILKDLTLFVDSQTYYEYVFANNGDLNSNGIYVTILDQLGIKLKQTETGLTKGQAILGLPKRYFMEIAFKSNPNGVIEFSDHLFFLQDKRIYKSTTYANGFAKDNNAFILLDLTGMNSVTE